MTDTAGSQTDELDQEGTRRLRPNHAVIGLGVLVALFTAASGVASVVNEFHDDSPITREVFANVPGPLKLAFYSVIPLLIIYGAVLFSYRVQNWQRGAPDDRSTKPANVKRRFGDFRSGVYMQTLLRDPAAGVMHALIYFPFLILMAVTTVLEINHQVPEGMKFLHGDVYRAYTAVGDIAGVLYLVGVVWAILRRYGPRRFRPYRIRIKSKPEHAAVLLIFLAIGITGFGAEAFRIALQDATPGGYGAEPETWSVVGYPLAMAIGEANWLMDDVAGWHQGWWIAHVASFMAFLALLPITMIRHMFTSPLNMYLKDRSRPKGAMKPMPNLMETELESFGVATIEDFTWKQLLDTDSCTMCGRCTSVCPAHATGKPLDPREIVLKTGEVMAATGNPQVSPPIGTDAEITVPANWMFDRITNDELWACTSCRACDEHCPVNIGDLEGIEVLDGGDPFEADYLYWVGCAGSFDDKNKKVSRAMAMLMQRAGVSFSILGPSEMCTGDPARRSGNEYIFQMLAMQNVETLDGMGVKKIVTQCPHCFNTLANEYPQMGGHYEVVHHSQLLEWLIAEGKLDMSEARLEERVVYHDSCYLGRHNDVYSSPRNVIGSLAGIDLVEADRQGTKGMCCGAGGGRMFMEENIGKNINVERSQELLATGAGRIATACPFCYIMIDDGVKGEGVEDSEVKVGDIALHLIEALDAGND